MQSSRRTKDWRPLPRDYLRLEVHDPAELGPPTIPRTVRIVDARVRPDGTLRRFDPLAETPPEGDLPDMAEWPRLEWEWDGLSAKASAQVEAWLEGRAPLPSAQDWDRAWKPVVARASGVQAQSPDGALGRFARLALPGDNGLVLRSPEWLRAVLDFARRWGPLRVCLHRLPGSHVVGLDEHLHPERCPVLHELRGDHCQPYEPLSVWLTWARQAAATLRLADDLQEHRPGDTKDREALGLASGPRAPGSAWAMAEQLSGLAAQVQQPELANMAAVFRQSGQDPASLARQDLDRAIARWFMLAGAIPTLRRANDGRMVASLDTAPGAFGLLALRLVAAYVGGRIRRCGACNQPREVQNGDRRPRWDRAWYCSAECRQEAHRIVARESKKRRKEQKRGNTERVG
ncbi:MAG: hypothetical protein HY690_05260 [Chloroflexi bacterium]|nr:hypothetical protein [Chloroflexota bacterium]